MRSDIILYDKFSLQLNNLFKFFVILISKNPKKININYNLQLIYINTHLNYNNSKKLILKMFIFYIIIKQ
jgi:hypothetical protein